MLALHIKKKWTFPCWYTKTSACIRNNEIVHEETFFKKEIVYMCIFIVVLFSSSSTLAERKKLMLVKFPCIIPFLGHRPFTDWWMLLSHSSTINRHKILHPVSGGYGATEVYVLQTQGQELLWKILESGCGQPMVSIMTEPCSHNLPDLLDSICRWNCIIFYLVKDGRPGTQYMSWFLLRKTVGSTNLRCPWIWKIL